MLHSTTFTPRVVLTPRTPSSYALTAGTIEQVAAHLARAGYHHEPPRSTHEHARYRHPNGGLAVLYAQSVLCQGQATQVHHTLADLVEKETHD